jgi:hypothetical protein
MGEGKMTKKDKARIEELEAQVKWLQFQIDKLQERRYSPPVWVYPQLWQTYPVVTCSSNTTVSGVK